MSTTVKVQVRADHIERLARKRSPLDAVAELMWNAVDGDATTVDVYLDEDAMGGLSVRVVDNGHGIEHKQALRSFRDLGASWKRGSHSPGGRLLHGKAGEGRFSAFSIGTHVRWTTRWRDGNQTKEFEISGSFDRLGTFEVTDPKAAKTRQTGTEVEITSIDMSPRSLLADTAPTRLAETFALYLRLYPHVRLRFDGKPVDPATLEEHVEDLELQGVVDSKGEPVRATLTVIEWNQPVSRELVLCDGDGFALGTTKAGVHARGWNFTAYLKSDLLRALADQGAIELADLHPDLRGLLDAAKQTMKDYFRRRAAEEAKSVVDQWKEEEVYPYVGQPKSPVEEVERQVFDVVALGVNDYLPDFAESNATSKKFSLQMLKTAIEQSPGELKRIIQEVLDLPQEKRQELVELLERTSLSAIINASKVVVDRLDFLAGLEVVLFEAEAKKKTKERQHLHRLLAGNPWVFGEEFHLSVDDQSLNEVLRKHLKHLGRDPKEGLAPVKRLDGSTGIVDLMLSKQTVLPGGNSFEHLVVELKRPAQDINGDVVQQIESYAFAVAKDERFRDSKVRWVFWAISNEMDDFARQKVTGQPDRPDGLLDRKASPNMTIWLKTWGQVLDECRGRLQFFRERLDYMATHEQGLAHLQGVYKDNVPNLGADDETS